MSVPKTVLSASSKPLLGDLTAGFGLATGRRGSSREDELIQTADILSRKRLKEKINALLQRGNPTPWPELQARLNRFPSGWAEYFSFGFTGQADDAIGWHVKEGFDVSCVGGTSFASAEPAASGTPRSMGRWESSTSTRCACTGDPCMLSREARPRAGCGRSASPVR